MKSARHLLATALAATCLTCGDSSGPNTGGSVTLGNGTLTSFMRLDANGDPDTIGVVFDSALLQNLPNVDTFMTVSLGSQATGTIYTHLYFDFVHMGHEPAMVFDTAHFDLHWYFISDQERMTIQPMVDTYTVAAAKLPPNYAKATQSVQRMGVHYADTTAPEFQGGQFDIAMVYGFHEGTFTFYDLMVTRHWLLTTPDTVHTMGLPTTYPLPGHYPTKWSVRYNATTKQYRIAIEGFVAR